LETEDFDEVLRSMEKQAKGLQRAYRGFEYKEAAANPTPLKRVLNELYMSAGGTPSTLAAALAGCAPPPLCVCAASSSG
jgi:hypothetical protein